MNSFGKAWRTGEGHDYFSIVEEAGRAGVFDGSGTYQASATAARLFEGLSRREPPLSLLEILGFTQKGLINRWPEGGPQTTATVIRLSEAKNRPTILHYVQSGDSPLLVINRDTGYLQPFVAEDERLPNGNTFSGKFLGAKGFEFERGRLFLPRFATIALLTDGVDVENIVEILMEDIDDPDKKAQTIINASRGTGDATTVIIEHRAA